MPTVISSFACPGKATALLFPIVQSIFNSQGIGAPRAFPSIPIQGASAGIATANAYSSRVAVSSAGVASAKAVGSAGIPIWPSGVPYAPLVGSWQMNSLYMNPLATDMESGSQRLRSRPGSGFQGIQFDIMMTLAQFTIMEAFVRNSLIFGASRFQMIVWLGDAFSSQTVQFEGGKSPQPVAVPPSKMRVTMTLRVFL